MTRVTQVKLGLVILGVLIFLSGAKSEHGALRWIGIGVVAVAWSLRFVERGRRRGERPDGGRPGQDPLK